MTFLLFDFILCWLIAIISKSSALSYIDDELILTPISLFDYVRPNKLNFRTQSLYYTLYSVILPTIHITIMLYLTELGFAIMILNMLFAMVVFQLKLIIFLK